MTTKMATLTPPLFRQILAQTDCSSDVLMFRCSDQWVIAEEADKMRIVQAIYMRRAQGEILVLPHSAALAMLDLQDQLQATRRLLQEAT